MLRPGSEKSGKGTQMLLRSDLAQAWQAWIGLRDLSASDLLFRVPKKLIKILDRDLSFAGIPKVDAQGRCRLMASLFSKRNRPKPGANG